MSSTEVRRGCAVLDGGFGKAEFGEEEGFGVGACDAVKAVKEDFVGGVGGEEGFDEVKVEDLLEKDNVVCDRIDDGDFQRAIGRLANLGEIDLNRMSDGKSSDVETEFRQREKRIQPVKAMR